MKRRTVEIGVCFQNNTWEVKGPYTVAAKSKLDASTKAVKLALAEVNESEVIHIFTYRIR